MGDHRANITLRMEIHGRVYQHEMSINYWPDENGMDRRVTECFAKWWADALGIYAEQCAEWEARGVEKRERAELARLRGKYGASG